MGLGPTLGDLHVRCGQGFGLVGGGGSEGVALRMGLGPTRDLHVRCGQGFA